MQRDCWPKWSSLNDELKHWYNHKKALYVGNNLVYLQCEDVIRSVISINLQKSVECVA